MIKFSGSPGMLGMHRVAFAADGHGVGFKASRRPIDTQIGHCAAATGDLIERLASLKSMIEVGGQVNIVGQRINEALERLGKAQSATDTPAILAEVDAAKKILLGAQELLKPLMIPPEREEEIPPKKGSQVISHYNSAAEFDPVKALGENVKFYGYQFNRKTRTVSRTKMSAARLSGLKGAGLFLAQADPTMALFTIDAGLLFNTMGLSIVPSTRYTPLLYVLLRASKRNWGKGPFQLEVSSQLPVRTGTSAVRIGNAFLLFQELMRREHAPRISRLEVAACHPVLFGERAQEFKASKQWNDFKDLISSTMTSAETTPPMGPFTEYYQKLDHYPRVARFSDFMLFDPLLDEITLSDRVTFSVASVPHIARKNFESIHRSET